MQTEDNGNVAMTSMIINLLSAVLEKYIRCLDNVCHELDIKLRVDGNMAQFEEMIKP
eukprot:Pgem_evm1s17850